MKPGECKWCGVGVHDGERSALVADVHRWCVAACFNLAGGWPAGDRAIARKIRGRARRKARQLQARQLDGGGGLQ